MLHPQNKSTQLLLFIAAIVVLVFLAGALPNLQFQSGDPFPFSLFSGGFGPMPGAPTAPSETSGDNLRLFAILFFWIGIPISLLMIIMSPEARKRFLNTLPAFFLIILFLIWLGNREPEPREPEAEVAGRAGMQGLETGLPPTPEFVADPPAWLLTTVNIIVGLIFLAIILLIWRWYNKRKADDPQALIVEEAERALADLEAGHDLKNIIMRCYAQMGEVLQREKHIKRRQGMTVREFETQLATTGLDDSHIHRLTQLFEQVRYSPNPLGGREEREAVDCLNAIVRAYGETS